MKIKTNLVPYQIDKQCPSCHKGFMIFTGYSINCTNKTKNQHKCDSCGFKYDYVNTHYPRIEHEKTNNSKTIL